MALKDTWKDLENAVVGDKNSGSDISVEPINRIAHAVIDLENKEKLENNSVTTQKIADGAVTPDKLSQKYVTPIELNVVKQEVANAIKGTASGETVALNDISPVEHNMSVKVSGVEDLSAVKLYRSGKNLFDTNKITKKTETTVEVDGTTYEVYDINGYSGDYLYKTNSSFLFDVNMKKGRTYTVSLIWMGSSDNQNIAGALYMPFKDVKGGNQCFDNMGAGSNILNAFGIQGVSKNPLTKITFTIKPTEDIVKGALCFYSYGVKGYVLKDSIQIEEGTLTDYEPYIEPTVYDVNADGKVYGVTSLYPTTILYTDTEGVLIDCEYNKDTNKVIENLTNAIISLGGNV